MRTSIKRTLIILSLAALLVVLAFTPVWAAVNEIVWRKSFAEGESLATGLVTDTNANVIVLGNTEDGPASLSKLSGGGRVLWTRRLDELGVWSNVRDAAIDADGHIYTVGEGSVGPYISKHGPKGGHHWTRKIPQDDWVYIQGVDVGPSGNIYIVGTTYDRLPNMRMWSGDRDAFIRKYNPDGKIFWTRQFSLSGFRGGRRGFRRRCRSRWRSIRRWVGRFA